MSRAADGGARIRSFLAIELGGDALPAAQAFLARLRGCGADVAWTRPENLHLTLKFLGGVAPARLDALRERLAGVVATHPSFALTLAGCGAFPAFGHPRILWVGVAGSGLVELVAAIETTAAAEGFPAEERSFHAHVTLGRVRSGRRRVERGARPKRHGMEALLALCRADATTTFGRSPAAAVTLFQSDLDRDGARHCALARLPLAGPAPPTGETESRPRPAGTDGGARAE